MAKNTLLAEINSAIKNTFLMSRFPVVIPSLLSNENDSVPRRNKPNTSKLVSTYLMLDVQQAM